MDLKKNNPTLKRPEGERVLDDVVVLVDVPAHIERLLREDSWRQGDKNAITLVKTSAMTITLLALRRDAIIEPGNMDVAGVVTIQVLKGAVGVETPRGIDDLITGQLIAIHEHLEFSITAREEETLCLLTVIMPAE